MCRVCFYSHCLQNEIQTALRAYASDSGAFGPKQSAAAQQVAGNIQHITWWSMWTVSPLGKRRTHRDRSSVLLSEDKMVNGKVFLKSVGDLLCCSYRQKECFCFDARMSLCTELSRLSGWMAAGQRDNRKSASFCYADLMKHRCIRLSNSENVVYRKNLSLSLKSNT